MKLKSWTVYKETHQGRLWVLVEDEQDHWGFWSFGETFLTGDSDEMIRFLSNSKWEEIDDIKIKLHIDKYKNPCSHINLKIKCHKCCRNMGNGRLKDSYY